MKTTITVLHPDGQQVRTCVDLPERPTFGDLANTMRRFLGFYDDPLGTGPIAEPMERVEALVGGERRDMFIASAGGFTLRTRGPLPVNQQATALYHAAMEGERLPAIYGPAVVVTGRRVWFEGEV